MACDVFRSKKKRAVLQIHKNFKSKFGGNLKK